jgi:hypothetical protein
MQNDPLLTEGLSYSCLEDAIPFRKRTLINLMKTIPKHVFGTDEIQRILRFLKTKENIPERDFVEAIERSGQVYSAVGVPASGVNVL